MALLLDSEFRWVLSIPSKGQSMKHPFLKRMLMR